MRPIDADELLEHKFKSASERMDLSVAYMSGWNDAIDAIIENAPTIEAEPVRHGHWIKKDHVFSKDTGIYRYECSECHCTDEHNEDREVPYCWQCGALMDEAEFALVRYGHWVKSEKSDFEWECSECGYGLTDNKLTYCYDCGAMMDEVDE